MKTKILALIISILCLSMIFVACDEQCEAHVDADNNGLCDNCEAAVEKEGEPEIETGSESETETTVETEAETQAPCDAHKDADADKLCDACGGAIVTIVEYVTSAQDTRVEMVVNPIPDANASDYLDGKFTPEFLSSTSSIKIEGNIHNVVANSIVYVTIQTENEDLTTTTTHQIIDVATVDQATGYFKVLWEGTESLETVETTTTRTTYTVSLSTYWYTITKTTAVTTPEEGTETTIQKQVYTYTGKAIGETWTNSEEEPYFNEPGYFIGSGTEVYIQYNDITYVVDGESYDLVYSESTLTIVQRPVMDKVVGDYGYVRKGDEYYIYDLTKWIDIAYLYKAESRYEDVEYYVLQNGNVLMTAVTRLPDGAVSYDYIENGEKYDIVYVMIDVAAKTASPLEFGYVINDLYAVEDGFTDAAAELNVVTVYPVVDGYVNYNGGMTLLVDNELKVVCELPELGRLVADGLYVRETGFPNGSYVYELVDANGKHVRYLSDNAYYSSYNGHIEQDNKFYSFNYELLVDLSEYYSYGYYGSYYKLVKQIEIPAEVEGEDPTYEYETYIYIPGYEPVKVAENTDEDKHNWTVQYFDNYYRVHYTVTETVDEVSTEVDVYELYSPDGSQFFSVKGEYILSVGLNGELNAVLTQNVEGQQFYYIIQ